MKDKEITYNTPEYNKPLCERNDNTKEVIGFIGEVPPCPECNDSMEYEDESGRLRGRGFCHSRLIPYINKNGNRRHLDWGETIARDSAGKLYQKSLVIKPTITWNWHCPTCFKSIDSSYYGPAPPKTGSCNECESQFDLIVLSEENK